MRKRGENNEQSMLTWANWYSTATVGRDGKAKCRPVYVLFEKEADCGLYEQSGKMFIKDMVQS